MGRSVTVKPDSFAVLGSMVIFLAFDLKSIDLPQAKEDSWPSLSEFAMPPTKRVILPVCLPMILIIPQAYIVIVENWSWKNIVFRTLRSVNPVVSLPCPLYQLIQYWIPEVHFC